MKTLFKKIWIEIASILILSLTPVLWFKDTTVILGHDNIFGLNPIIFLLGRLSTWTNHGYGQTQDLIIGTIPTHLIDAIPYFLGVSLHTTQTIVYVFWFLMIGLSMYVLAYTINPRSTTFRLVSIVLYQFNFFILQAWWIGERTKFSAYIAFPLILAVFLRVYRKEIKPFTASIYISLILFVFNAGGLFGIPLYGGFFLALIVFLFYFSFLGYRRGELGDVKRLILVSFYSFIGFLLVNAYYIFPAISQFLSQYASGLEKGGGVSGFIDWASEISANASYINIFRLQGIAEWYDNIDHPYARYFLTNPLLITVSFLWPLLTFFSLVIAKKKEKAEIILYLLLVYLLGIFFAAGTHPPLGYLYELFIRYVPGAIAFRSPYFKFAPAIFLTSSLLIAFTIDGLPNRIKKFSFVVFLIIVLAYHFPYFTGDFFSWRKGYSTRLHVPDYVLQFGNWLNSEKTDDTRVLFLPPNDPNFQYSAYNWGYLSFQAIPTLLSNKSVIVNNDSVNNQERDFTLELYYAIARGDIELTNRLLSILRVGYFVVQLDTSHNENSPTLLNSDIYKRFLEENHQFQKIKNLGKWTIYKNNGPVTSSFISSEKINVFSGALTDIGNFYNFTNTNLFIKNEDIGKDLPLSNDSITNYYIPDCLSCDRKDKPFIRILERNILPDSPLYPLVLFSERISLHTNDPKSLTYDYLGISLKRIGEMREMIISGKKITGDVLKNYSVLLENILTTFESLPRYEDKLQVATDISHYLENEHVAMAELVGVYATYGESANLVGQVAQDISFVIHKLEPYLFTLDTANNRFYQFSVDQAGVYEVNLKKEDFQSVLKEGARLTLVVDKNITREIKLDTNTTIGKWLSFGKIPLDKSTHHMLLSFPEFPNIADNLHSDRTEFSVNNENNCYTTKINNFDYKKTYRLKVNYNNDFTNDLFFYMWGVREDRKRLLNVFRLKTSFSNEELTRLIKTDSSVKDFIVGVCSRILTADMVQRKINVNINEIINANILVIPEKNISDAPQNVEFKRISSTKYTIDLPQNNGAFILSFMERFDNGWSLSGYENKHFRVNGYANGWLIDNPKQSVLTLEYKPQRIFSYGAIVTFITVAGGIFFLLFKRIKKRD